ERLQAVQDERLERVHRDRRDEADGPGLDLRQVPESPRRAGQTWSRAPDLCLLGDASPAIRLGQGGLPAAVRDRDELSADEPVPDPDDDGTVRGAVPVRGAGVVAA